MPDDLESTAKLTERRDHLADTVARLHSPRLVFSQSFTAGRKLFEETCRRELEGIVVKRIDSRYHVGKRSGDWIKIKRRLTGTFAIVGYVPKGASFEALSLAHADGTSAGTVQYGFSREERQVLMAYFRKSGRKPALRCQVNYSQVTPGGGLRDAVFERLGA